MIEGRTCIQNDIGALRERAVGLVGNGYDGCGTRTAFLYELNNLSAFPAPRQQHHCGVRRQFVEWSSSEASIRTAGRPLESSSACIAIPACQLAPIPEMKTDPAWRRIAAASSRAGLPAPSICDNDTASCAGCLRMSWKSLVSEAVARIDIAGVSDFA